MSKEATVQLGLDISKFRKSLSGAIEEAKRLAAILGDASALGQLEEIKVSVDASELEDARDLINDIDGSDPEVTVKVDDDEVQTTDDKIKDLPDEAPLKVTVDDQTQGAFAKIKQSIGDAFAQAKSGDLSGLGNLGGIAAGAAPGLSLAKDAIGAVTDAIGATVEAGANFDKALKQISISTGLTGDQLKVFEGQARAAFLGGVGETADEAARIVGQLQQTLGKNINTDELAKVATRSNQVAQSLGVETPELVGKLSPLIKQYGISFDEALNLVASGAQNGVADIGGYLDAINEFTPNLKEAGFSAEEFQGLLAKAGEQGVKDFAKVGDGVKELQNRIKSGDLTTQLEGIGGATSAELQKIAKLGQQGALSGAEVLRQSVGEIDKAFSSGQISEALRGQLLTTLGGSVAEDLGSEVYSKIFGANIDTKAIADKAKQAGQIIDESIPPPDLGRIFTDLQTQVGRALNFIYKDLIAPVLGPIIEAFKEAGNIIGSVFATEGGKAAGVFAVLKTVLGVVGKLIGGVVVNAIRLLVTSFNILTTPIRAVVSFVQFLVGKFLEAIGVSGKLGGVFRSLGEAANYLQTYLGVLFDAINLLVSGLANLDPAKIAEGWDKLNNVASNTSKKIADDAAAAAKAIADQDAAQKNLNKTNTDPPPVPDPDADAIKKAAQELAQLNRERAKANELAKADLLGTEEERQKARLAIEERYALLGFEAERKALTSKDKLRAAEEKVINARIEFLKEENLRKLREIEGKAAADRFKAAQDAENKVTEITLKVAEDRVARLKEILDAGGLAIAAELANAQRSLIEAQLSQSVDAIVASTPSFVKGAEEIGKLLTAGLIDEAEAKKRTAALRQTITGELLNLPGDSADPFAAQIRAAYDKAADAIAQGAQEIAAKLQQASGPQSGLGAFIDQLGTLNQTLADVDYAGPFNRAAEATRALTEEQEKLIGKVKEGEVSYQDAIAQFTELEKQRQQQASATAEVVGAAFLAIAQSQIKAAQDATAKIGELNSRNREIADELVAIEARKNAAIAALREQDFANAQLYEAAKTQIADKATQDADKLEAERAANSQKAAAKQEEALAEIGAAAGSAFAGLLTGAQDSGEALKAVVGDTVKSLLLLYTPSIVALFSSIIPPPFGQIAGFAAVAALQALLASALSGFSEGGYTGNVGTGQVAGVVHGQEFVLNAKATRQNRGLLEHLNAGGSVATFAGAPVTELQMMRAELQAIRQRLDGMPNGIQGKQAVTVDVGFDTYLYQRNQQRAAVRNLRG